MGRCQALDKPVEFPEAQLFPGKRLVAVFDVVNNAADQVGRRHDGIERFFKALNDDGKRPRHLVQRVV
jgi:hypothetical protein